jgi:hypothetical protein
MPMGDQKDENATANVSRLMKERGLKIGTFWQTRAEKSFCFFTLALRARVQHSPFAF